MFPAVGQMTGIAASGGGSGVAALGILGIGDSQTNNLGSQNFIEVFADLVQSRQSRTVTRTHHGLSGNSWKYAYPGNTPLTASLYDDLPNVIPLVGPNTVGTMFAGTNGLFLGGHTPAQELSDASDYLTAFFAQTTATPANWALVTMPPRQNYSSANIATYNAGLATLATTFGMKLIKLHLNTDFGTVLGVDFFDADQIHLNAAAHDQLGRMCYDKFYTDFTAAFTVSQLPGYYEHYDAQVGASITQAGSRVSAWAAQNNSARNLGQGTSGNQPLYAATGINGHPAIQFDGGSRRAFLFNTGFALQANNCSIWLVGGLTTAAADNLFLVLSTDNVTWSSGIEFKTDPSNNILLADDVNGGSVQYSASADTSLHTFTAEMHLAGGGMSTRGGNIFKDGGGGGAGGPSGNTAVNATALRLGSPVLDFWRLQGYIGEVGFCSTRLNSYWRQLLESKLATKWGTAAPPVP